MTGDKSCISRDSTFDGSNSCYNVNNVQRQHDKIREISDANVTMVENIINNLFTRLKYSRGELKSVEISKIAPDFSQHIESYILNKNEASMSTGLVADVTRPLDPSTLLVSISADEWQRLEGVLAMQPPKIVTRYTASRVPLTDIAPKRKKRSRHLHNQQQQRKQHQYSNLQTDKMQPQLASIYNDDRAVGSKRQRNSSQSHHGSGGSSSDSDYESEDGNTVTANATLSSNGRGLPMNFYELTNPLMDEFLDEDYEDMALKFPFVARIEQNNCRRFGLADFAPKSSSFSVIKEKLESRKYGSEEDFLSDFKQGLENVRQYYPDDHPAQQKAAELWDRLKKRWEHIRTQFT